MKKLLFVCIVSLSGSLLFAGSFVLTKLKVVNGSPSSNQFYSVLLLVTVFFLLAGIIFCFIIFNNKK